MIYLLLSLIAIPFLGMLYFMKKVKDGGITLSEKSWHFKLLSYMWNVNVKSLTNMCPYYWSVVCSVIILIPYLFCKYSWELADWCENLIKWDKMVNRIKSPKKDKKPLFVVSIPQSKKDVFNVIWKNGSNIFDAIIIVITLITMLFIIVNLMYLSFTFNFILGCIVVAALLYVLSIVISFNYPKYKEIMFDPWVVFFKGIFGIVSQPLKLIWQLLLKLFNVYENLCPAINWDSKNDNN